MRRAGGLACVWLLGAAAPVDDAARLVEAKRVAQVAAARAKALERAAASEAGAADRARAQERALAARVDAAAADLDAARARLALVQARLAGQRARLAAGQAPAARLLGSLAMLARRPAIAGVAQPGTLADQVHVRAVLAGALPAVRERTAALRDQLVRLRALENAAALAATGLRDGAARLERDRAALARAEAAHRGRAAALGRDAVGQGDLALAMGERARDLVDRMGERGRATATAGDLATLPAPPIPAGDAPPPRGVYRLPVAGRLVTGLGEVSDAGVRSRGLSFAVADGAPVVAPAAGTVRYAGRFRRYGGIVILDHGAGWTTLLTGLATSSVRVGQAVAAGETVGRAGGGEDPRITVELRRRGEPVDIAALVG